MKSPKYWSAVVVCVVVSVGWLFFGVDRISKDDLTLRAINELSRAIGAHYVGHKVLPAQLREMKRAKPDNDAWGNPIVYVVRGDNEYVLTSYGKDGVPSDDDISRIFSASDLTTESSRRPAAEGGNMPITFVASMEGGWHLCTVGEDGLAPRQLISSMSRDENEPSWSADHKRIAYSTSDGRIRILDVASKAETLVPTAEKSSKQTSPCFSPDGRQLVYITLRAGTLDYTELMIYDFERGTHHRLLEQFGPQMHPRWSPDGKQIVYTSASCGTACGRVIQELWIADANGKSARQLLMTNSHCTHPAWSPDGKKIAFSSDKAGGFDIWILTLEGGRLEQLTNDAALDTSPAWSPEGQRLAFISNRTGKLRIWIRDLRTGEETMFFPFEDEAVECRDVTW